MKAASSGGGLSKGRIEAFSDGVFAIVITLLIFEIKVPDVPRGASGRELEHALLQLWPKFLSYLISVVVVAIYWVAHHAIFHWIRRSDRTLLWINVLFLSVVVCIPFSAGLLGQYYNYQVALVFYGVNMVAAGLALYLLWWYATTGRRLVDSDIHPDVVRTAKVRILSGFFVYSVSIGLSFFSPTLSLLIYVLLPVLYILPSRIDRFWATPKERRAQGTETLQVQDSPTPEEQQGIWRDREGA
jgi:uncharacterized membrane protein